MRAPERDHALDFWGRLGFPAVLKGLALVGKYFFSRKVTQQYPEVPTVPLRDFRGEHVLTVDEKGNANCVACFLCATACPSRCIEIVAEPAPPDWGRDKRAKVFNIDMLRCIYCGMCEEACPVDAIALTSHYYEVAESRAEKIYDKERLIANNRFYTKGPQRSALRPSLASAPPRGGFAPSASPGPSWRPGGSASPPDSPSRPPAGPAPAGPEPGPAMHR